MSKKRVKAILLSDKTQFQKGYNEATRDFCEMLRNAFGQPCRYAECVYECDSHNWECWKQFLNNYQEMSGAERLPVKFKIKDNIEVHARRYKDYDDFLASISNEAIKEFAERLKARYYYCKSGEHICNNIDTLVKEMVSENNV